MAFDVQRQLTLQVSPPQFGLVELRTEGLAAVGHPELVLVGAPADLMNEAGFLLNTVADYVANHRSVADGERVGLPYPGCGLVLRLVGHGAGAQRVVDGFDPAEGAPYIALASVLCLRADQDAQAGDLATAEAALRRSLAVPIAPEVDGDELPFAYNWGGALGALRLADLEGQDREAWLREACRRSVRIQRDRFGDPLADLGGADAATLRNLLPLLVGNQRARLEPQSAGRVVVFTGLLVSAGAGGIRFARTVLPPAIAERLWSEEVFAGLLSLETAAVAAELVTTRDPFALLELTRAGAELYGESPQHVPTPIPWVRGVRLASLVLADASRLLAGGALPADLAAHYGLRSDPAAVARVAAAAARFEQVERAGFTAALQR